MLKAKHNFVVHPFFKWYAGSIIKRHFGIVRIVGEIQKKNLPVLLISNHISWWDGFWAMYINLKVLHRKFHFMMLEEQLLKFRFFNYTGGFSVNKKSRSIIETLNYTTELLSDKENMVLVFPQGEIQSQHNQSFHFEKGLERILKDKRDKIQIVFLANLVDYFSNRKPGIYFHLQENNNIVNDMADLQQQYNLFYVQSVEKQKQFKV
jgi:1-acyl-sn-glycerol-3-phosphate acyltransferase